MESEYKERAEEILFFLSAKQRAQPFIGLSKEEKELIITAMCQLAEEVKKSCVEEAE